MSGREGLAKNVEMVKTIRDPLEDYEIMLRLLAINGLQIRC